MPFSWTDTEELPGLANAYGLDCYDPQTDKVQRAHEGTGRRAEGSAVDAVRGRVSEDNVARLLGHISEHIGYSYDDLDEAELTGALDGTNDEYPEAWFDPVLEARIQKLFDML